jgi:protein TonB
MVAIAIVVMLHAALGYAFITGLAYNVVKKAVQDLKTFDVEDQPPPPEAPPPPPPKQVEVQPPPVVTPPPLVQTPQVMQPPLVQTPAPPPPMLAPPTPAPPPPKPSIATPGKAKGNPGDWVTSEDYPASEMRAEHQGVTGFRLDVGPDGKATNCTVTASSGFPALDDTACRMLIRRGRFSPAKDASGTPMPFSYSNRVRWQIPKD